jgi:hypothetical protein
VGRKGVSFRLDRVDDLKACWTSGFMDGQLCNNMKGAFKYVKKYVVKSSDGRDKLSNGLKTLALGWYFHKRSFSLSGAFREAYSDLIIDLNSNSNKFHPYFRRLDGTKVLDEVVEWHLYGVVRSEVGWGSSWTEVSRKKIDELTESGELELRGISRGD